MGSDGSVALAGVYLTSCPVVTSVPKIKSKRQDEESPRAMGQLARADHAAGGRPARERGDPG